jgi:phosphate uptake regulator
MITLPKDWANSVGLNKNDTVGVQAHPDGSLSLYPKGSAPAPKRCTKVIDVSKTKDRGFLNRQLIGAYVAGHTSILVTSDQSMPTSVSAAIANFVQTAIGLEIIEADDTHMLISDLLEHKAIDPKKTIERMRLLVRGMIRDVFDAAYTGNLDGITDMKSRDTEIDRIYWLTSRQCNIVQKDLAASNRMSLPLFEMTACLALTRILEVIGDHVIIVASYLNRLNEGEGTCSRIDKETYDFGMKAVDIMANAVKSWVDRDMVLADKTVKDADEMIAIACKASKSVAVTECISVSAKDLMLFSARRMCEYSKLISETTFDVAME